MPTTFLRLVSICYLGFGVNPMENLPEPDVHLVNTFFKKSDPNQMPKPPQLVPFDIKEQWLCSELPPDFIAPRPVSKAELSHPTDDIHLAACIRLKKIQQKACISGKCAPSFNEYT